MAKYEDPVAQAERHVREAENRIARQRSLIYELESHGHTASANDARDLLKTFQDTLTVARNHLRIEREQHKPR